ncbi:MAG: helix-turn-helix transcriptional regulator [Candidatus Heimdallarchaeota archaeon]|nr:MAG: helix-turn-helix transcriptional regulator [Candidatus Heimdallarchaeota archaeon]
MIGIIVISLFIKTDITSGSFTFTQDRSTLFITENIDDNSLAIALNESLRSHGDIMDIRASENLNDLFLNEKLLDTYSQIIMILNQVSDPFNETIVDSLEKFINKGGIFCIISPQIWRFPTTFHTLSGLNIDSGQKEWPPGNNTENITLTIVNDTFTQSPFQIEKNSTIEVVGSLGITASIDDSITIATTQDTPSGKATITGFRRQSGFIIAIPLSIKYNSSYILFNQFLTSVLSSGIEFSETSHLNSMSNGENPIIPLFNISEETVQAGAVVASIAFLLIGLAYMISKWSVQNKDIEIPKDRDWFSIILLTPLLLIGQIIYPPVVRRIDEYDVYENHYRSRIINILEERDFLHFRELKRELGIGTSSLRWHLQVLEDFRIIKRKIVGQYEIFYLLRNEPNPDFLEIYFAIISGLGFRIAKAFKEMNSWDLKALTEYLGSSKESIRYHTKKFQKINLIRLRNDRFFLNSTKYKELIEAIDRRDKTN